MRRVELRARRGAALILALLLLVVLDCVVLGTLHVAILERRTTDNALAAFRLRLAAESAVRAAIGNWPAAADSLAPLTPPLIVGRALTIEGYERHASIERIGGALFAVRGEAAERSGTGRATALLLVAAPAFPADTDFAPAALSVRGRLDLRGTIESLTSLECPDNPDIAILIPALDLLVSPGRVTGQIGYLSPVDDQTARVPDAIARRADSADALMTVTGDFVLSGNTTGVLLIDGNLAIPTGVTFDGLILVTGDITIAAGASVRGAVHAGGAARVDGALVLDACTVLAEVRRTRLTVPQPAPGRAWLPAY